MSGKTEADERFDTTVDGVNNVEVGDEVTYSKVLSESDVEKFSEASGDRNPLHLDEESGENSMFGETIVHGMLVSGVISAALARVPGNVIYLSQDLEFKQPVKKGERVTAKCEVEEVKDSNRYDIHTEVENSVGDTVIDGCATVMIN